ncbi:unknown [Firmicutes bacterium CAG:170]|nr:unknown [Firmicutes bacterium CAG:170]
MATLANTGFVTENFAEGDFVLVQGVVTPDKQGVLGIDIKSMTAAKTELTKLTGLDNISAVANMYVNGTKTPVACKYAYDADRTVADCWDTFTFIYDSYGNVIGTTKYTAPANYAVLDKLYIDYAKGDGTVYATVVTPAGEKTDITVNTITAILPGNENTGKAVKAADFIASLDDDMFKGLGFQYQWSGSKFYSYYYGQLVDYVVNENGSYDINIPGRAKQVKNAIIVKGSKFIYDGTNTKIPVLEVTADTIFLYQNGYAPNATYTSVTGYENLPATLVATEIQYIVKGGKVALVYVLNPQPVNSYKQVYYAGGQPSYDTSTGVGIYTYAVKVLGENGMEDGVITSKEPVFSGKPAGVYKVTLNASGLATKVELASADNYVVTLHAAPVNNTTYWYGTDEAHAKILDLSVVAFFNVSGDNTVNKTNLDGKNVSLIFDANGAAVAAYYYG